MGKGGREARQAGKTGLKLDLLSDQRYRGTLLAVPDTGEAEAGGCEFETRHSETLLFLKLI